MNILNYDEIEITSLKEVIEKQKEIMIAFEPDLEKRIKEFDIDIPEDQALLKDFLLTRTVEELTEASIALKARHFEHFKEELVDSFNFLIEASIFVFHYEDIPEKEKTIFNIDESQEGQFLNLPLVHTSIRNIREHIYDTIEAIGLCTNKLKLRPWRTSQYPVDLISFRECYKDIWNQFYLLLDYSGITLNSLLKVWSRKYQVNKFRIDSNY